MSESLTPRERIRAQGLCHAWGIAITDELFEAFPREAEELGAFLVDHMLRPGVRMTDDEIWLVVRYLQEEAVNWGLGRLVARGDLVCDTSVDPPRYHLKDAHQQDEER